MRGVRVSQPGFCYVCHLLQLLLANSLDKKAMPCHYFNSHHTPEAAGVSYLTWPACAATFTAPDATGSQELLAQQLPLDPCSCSAVQLSGRGLQATGAPADAAASEAAVAALEQQRPATLQQGQALRLALGQVRAKGTMHVRCHCVNALLEPQPR
jgi:hypothetical protein